MFSKRHSFVQGRSVELVFCRYRKMLIWNDKTLAHVLDAVSAYSGMKFYGNKCGELSHAKTVQKGQSEKLFLGIVLYECKYFSVHASSYHLCQLDNPLDITAGSHSISPTSLHATFWDMRFTVCPYQHVTHSFLACDERSACWAQGVVSFSSERATWDLPSPLSCPVPGMTSLPPSYACVTGSSRVPYTFVCDHRQDCGDNSDEEFCQFAACRAERPLQCGNIKQVVRESAELKAGIFSECKIMGSNTVGFPPTFVLWRYMLVFWDVKVDLLSKKHSTVNNDFIRFHVFVTRLLRWDTNG